MGKDEILKANVNTQEKELKKTILCILKGSIFAIILSVILLTIFALLLTYTQLSESTIMPVVLTITGISILIGGTISSRKMKKNGLLYGGSVGLIYIIILYLASSLCLTGFSLSNKSFLMIVVGIITGMIGGIVGVNLKT